MATLFTHPLIPIAIVLALGKLGGSPRLLFYACLASVLPDIDVLAFNFGIPYASEFGHRGFTHSFAFAAGIGLLGVVFCRQLAASPAAAFGLLFIAMASHGLLDAMTNGGLGVALFWPFTADRLFLPWTPVEVSPIGISGFFTERGAVVLLSEFKWIWMPLVLVTAISCLFRRVVNRKMAGRIATAEETTDA